MAGAGAQMAAGFCADGNKLLCAGLALLAMVASILALVLPAYFIGRLGINIICWGWGGEGDEEMDWKWIEWVGPGTFKYFPWIVDDVTQCSIKCDDIINCGGHGVATPTDNFYPDCQCKSCSPGYSGPSCSPVPASHGPASHGPATPGPPTSGTPTSGTPTSGTPTPGPTPPTPGPPLTLCKANGMTPTTGGGCPAQAVGTACSRYYDPAGSVFCKQTPGGNQQCMAGDSCALPPQCQCTVPAGSDGVNSPTDCKEPATGEIKYRRKLNLCNSKLSQSACESSSFPAPGTCQWVDHDQRYLY